MAPTVMGQTPSPAPITSVPRLIRISNTFQPRDGRARAPIEKVTFAIYSQEHGGDPLWQEVQRVSLDADGKYSVLLGSSLVDGMPVELFNTGSPLWLGVQFNRAGETEQPRFLLASVPYALRASDVDTLGGRPASSYLLNPNPSSENAPATSSLAGSAAKSIKPRANSGAPGFLGVFANSTDLVNSNVYQRGGLIGVNTTLPFDYLHVRFTDLTGAFTGFAVQNLNNTMNSFSGMLFYDQNSLLAQFQGFNNLTHEYRINNISSGGSINFMIGGNSKFDVAATGRIGIGTTSPRAGVEVATGDIYISLP